MRKSASISTKFHKWRHRIRRQSQRMRCTAAICPVMRCCIQYIKFDGNAKQTTPAICLKSVHLRLFVGVRIALLHKSDCGILCEVPIFSAILQFLCDIFQYRRRFSKNRFIFQKFSEYFLQPDTLLQIFCMYRRNFARRVTISARLQIRAKYGIMICRKICCTDFAARDSGETIWKNNA